MVQPKTVYMPQFAPTSMKQRERRMFSRITGAVSFSHSRSPDQNTRWPISSNSVGNHRHFQPVPYIVNGSSAQRQGKNFRTLDGRTPRWHAQVTGPRKGVQQKRYAKSFQYCANAFQFGSPPYTVPTHDAIGPYDRRERSDRKNTRLKFSHRCI